MQAVARFFAVVLLAAFFVMGLLLTCVGVTYSMQCLNGSSEEVVLGIVTIFIVAVCWGATITLAVGAIARFRKGRKHA